jgi:hypothetical protein
MIYKEPTFIATPARSWGLLLAFSRQCFIRGNRYGVVQFITEWLINKEVATAT